MVIRRLLPLCIPTFSTIITISPSSSRSTSIQQHAVSFTATASTDSSSASKRHGTILCFCFIQCQQTAVWCGGASHVPSLSSHVSEERAAEIIAAAVAASAADSIGNNTMPATDGNNIMLTCHLLVVTDPPHWEQQYDTRRSGKCVDARKCKVSPEAVIQTQGTFEQGTEVPSLPLVHMPPETKTTML